MLLLLNTTIMKNLFTSTLVMLLALLILPAVCMAQKSNTASPYMAKEFTVQQPGNLKVETSGGSIEVLAQEGNTIRVEMYLQVGEKKIAPGDAKGEKILEDFNIDISQSANTVSAIAEKKNNKNYNGNNYPSVSFTVYVPRQISTNLNTSGGSIRLEGIEGNQDVETSGGSLSFKNLTGKVEGNTSGGSIDINDYTGTLNAHTSGGTINLEDSKGELNVHTSGGTINIENVQGSIDASTSGGSINATLLTIDKYVKLHTSGGNIKAILPSGVGLDLDLQGEKVNTKLENFNGQADEDRVRGSMNGGGIEVVMSTSGGTVDLDYQ